ncbi:MAG TPA: M55 family metallopeptidase [Terriglobia bacterium]
MDQSVQDRIRGRVKAGVLGLPRARRFILILSLSLLALRAAAQTGLKVYISTDMEGVDGVSTSVQSSSSGREYQEFRRLLTEEANAAVAGAFDAGATEVLVSDSHADGQNIDLDLFDKRARLIRGWPRPLGMMGGIDNTFAAAAFVGFHASEGTAGATLPHTFNGTMTLALDGTAVGEIGFDAAIAGEFGVPVVFLSGDQMAGEEAKTLLGGIETAEVKHSLGYHAAIMLPPEQARELIRVGMKRGVERRAGIKPYRIAHPVRLAITFQQLLDAEILSYLPGVERPRPDTVVFTAPDMIEASKFMEVALHRVD